MFAAETDARSASTIKEWETIDAETIGGSGAEDVRMVEDEPATGPFACFKGTFSFFK